LPNVHFVGRVPYEELPELIAHCNVGLVPFRIGAISADASPGKAYQYLACGLPVLCTPFLREDTFEGHVATAPGSVAEFSEAIEKLLGGDSADLRARRRAFALRQTWAARFDVIEAELADAVSLAKRPSDLALVHREQEHEAGGSG
jgi:glycosyltransferase involved in cell wall biosynthesis